MPVVCETYSSKRLRVVQNPVRAFFDITKRLALSSETQIAPDTVFLTDCAVEGENEADYAPGSSPDGLSLKKQDLEKRFDEQPQFTER